MPIIRHRTKEFSQLSFPNYLFNRFLLKLALIPSMLQPLALKTRAIFNYSLKIDCYLPLASGSCDIDGSADDYYEAISSRFTLVIQNTCLCSG